MKQDTLKLRLGLLLIIIGAMGVGFGMASISRGYLVTPCNPLPAQSSTLRCWSGGRLVVNQHVYRDGGHFCTLDGRVVEILSGDALCVLEESE